MTSHRPLEFGLPRFCRDYLGGDFFDSDNHGRTLFIVVQIAGAMGAVFLILADAGRHVPWAIYGIFLGQLTLAAIGAALGPWSLGKRLLLPPVWTVDLYLPLAIALGGYGPPSAYFVVGLLVAGATFLMQAPFWALRWFGRARIDYLWSFGDPRAAAATRQFGIRGLLVLTLIVAAILGLSRALLPKSVIVDFVETPLEQWLLPLCLLAVAALCGLAAVLSALRFGEVVMAVGVATTCVILLLFAFLAAGESLGLRGDDLYEVPLGLFAHFVWTTGSLLAVRRTGLRIARVPR